MTDRKKKEATPRGAAVWILNRVERQHEHAEPLLDAQLSTARFSSPHDRGLLTELVYGTLRMRGHLDWILSGHYHGNLAKLEVPLLNILRTAVYQLFFTDRIPAFAAVHEAVTLAGKIRPAAAKLVNALLRSILRGKERIVWPELERDPALSISVVHSHPRWLVDRWLQRHGVDETVAICRANNAAAPCALRANRLKGSREAAIAALVADGIAAGPCRYSEEGLVLLSPAAGLRESGAFRGGLIRVQDEASQLVARLCGPQPGERVLDLCAGSGGKSLHLAALIENRGLVTAVDLHRDKLRRLAAEAGRLGVTAIETVEADALAPPPRFAGTFDRVLLDAPCSGLGTLRRNPEIRWRIVPSALEQAAALQRRLLGSAARCVKPGGTLAYSTCTVTTEENEAVAAAFLAAHPAFDRIAPAGLPAELVDGDGFYRTHPHRHGTDGFFGALFVRRG